MGPESWKGSVRWCPVCEGNGVPIVWGEPTIQEARLAEEGQVILAGTVGTGVCPTHVCSVCRAEFIASSLIYQRPHAGREAFGIGVWPHGHRQVRIEPWPDGWTVIVAGEGSMLLDRDALQVFPNDVFADMWPWEVEDWAAKRGFSIEVRPGSEGWGITINQGSGFFELTLAKAWWRSLGRDPVAAAIERLTTSDSAPIWLPGDW